MTPTECQRFCRIYGTRYASLQAGAHCFCGDMYDNYGPSAGCRSKCPGDASLICGGGGANQVYRIAGPAEEVFAAKDLGCFKDTGNRALNGHFTSTAVNSNKLCIKRCAEQGFKYAATQSALQCFCGNNEDYDKYGSAECNTPCRPDESENCGGTWANRVYEIAKPKLKRLGCYMDKSVRAMTGHWYQSTYNTNEQCIKTCKALGYKYAGTENGQLCMCGNQYDTYGILPDTRCNSACPRNNKHACGGSWALSVFETGANGKITEAKATRAIELGCQVNNGDYAMVQFKGHSNKKMTPEYCIEICNAAGSKYATILTGLWCICEDRYLQRGDHFLCNTPCYGDKYRFCGGGGTRRVYLIGEHAKAEPLPATVPVTTEKPTPAPTPKPTKPPKTPKPTKPPKTPKPTKPPKTPKPTPAPTTEAPETCTKEIEAFATNELGFEPTFSEGCTFEAKQCDGEKCYCVKTKNGKLAWDDVIVPASEPFDCSAKPKKCMKKRFKLLLKGKKNVFVPECNKKGQYAPMQCHNGECWCVKPRGGKEKKNTRTKGKADC